LPNLIVRTDSGNDIGSFDRKSDAIELARRTYVESRVHAEVVSRIGIEYRTKDYIEYREALREAENR
jgi:hypothetical protein